MSSINVSFMKRVTTGPYEHEEMSVQFQVESQDLLSSTTEHYRAFVYRTLGKPLTAVQETTSTKTSQPSTTETTSSTKGEENGKSSEKSRSEKSGKKSGQKSQQEEVVETTSKTVESEEMEEVESPFKETPKAEPSSAKETTKKEGKKASKEDGIPYDSVKEEHKSTLSNFLTKLTGSKEWAKDKARSKKISAEILHGQPFLAKDGSILPTFQNLCSEHFGGNTADVL
jgi:DNA mismatch repair ATPase MutL